MGKRLLNVCVRWYFEFSIWQGMGRPIWNFLMPLTATVANVCELMWNVVFNIFHSISTNTNFQWTFSQLSCRPEHTSTHTHTADRLQCLDYKVVSKLSINLSTFIIICKHLKWKRAIEIAFILQNSHIYSTLTLYNLWTPWIYMTVVEVYWNCTSSIWRHTYEDCVWVFSDLFGGNYASNHCSRDSGAGSDSSQASLSSQLPHSQDWGAIDSQNSGTSQDLYQPSQTFQVQLALSVRIFFTFFFQISKKLVLKHFWIDASNNIKMQLHF